MASTGFSFHRNNNALIATYSPYNGIDWLKDRFTNEETISIKSTYLIRKEDLIPSYEELTDENSSHSSFQFRVAMLEKDFYKFDREMLDIPINLFFHRNIGIEPKYITLRDYPVSIFPVIAKVILEDIYIVPDDYNDLQPKNVLPISSLKNLLNDFPNSTEMTHYRNQRIDIVIGEFFTEKNEAREKYQKYMNRKISRSAQTISPLFNDYDIYKYTAIQERLKEMLHDYEQYNEEQWQKAICDILLLLFPRYVKVLEKVKIKDSEKADKYREIDFMFVDYNGNIDIVEIKRPNANDLLRKAMYRDNYVPARVLSSTVMQVEKYIFYLNKWGKNGEKILTEKYGAYLPSDMEIRIANPKGLLVLGKEREFDEQAKLDFELIKRQYSNIADIITYDDLLRRIERLLFKFNNKSTRPNS